MLGLRKEIRDRHLIAVLADPDTITGMLLAGIGTSDSPNYQVTDSKTPVNIIEEAFKKFVQRRDVAVVIITQSVAERIRHLVDDYEQVLPALVEIPSKEAVYDIEKDSLLRRINKLCVSE